MKLKVYICGKVNPDSSVGKLEWRDDFCRRLSQLTGFRINNIDPTKTPKDFNENNPVLVYGRDCYMISIADLVIVNLTDDISVGGSQEMLIAKYFGKPLIGIARKEGKFVRREKIIGGRTFHDYTAAFVAVPCDEVVHDLEGCAKVVRRWFETEDILLVKYDVIAESLEYYLKFYYKFDTVLENFGGVVAVNPKTNLDHIGKIANALEDQLGITLDDVLHKLLQEFGELNDAIQKFRGRYCRKRVSIAVVHAEMGDVLMNLASISARLGIWPSRFGEFASNTLAKFQTRYDDYLKVQEKQNYPK